MLAVIGARSLGDEYDTGLTLNSKICICWIQTSDHMWHLAPPGALASDILTLPVTMAALFCIFLWTFYQFS